MAPEPLWERVNALDSNGYLVASILVSPIAAGMVSLFGGQVAIIAIGVPFGLATLALLGVHEPYTETSSSGSLRRDVVDGIRYAWRNCTIRGLAVAISTVNLAGGILTIVLPLLILERLHGSEVLVGLAYAVSGVAGMVTVFLSARMDTRGREWHMLVYTIVFTAPAYGLLLIANSSVAVATPVIGLTLIGLCMLVVGLLNGPSDIGLFTIRQPRTDRPEWAVPSRSPWPSTSPGFRWGPPSPVRWPRPHLTSRSWWRSWSPPSPRRSSWWSWCPGATRPRTSRERRSWP